MEQPDTKVVDGEKGSWLLSRAPVITGVDLRDARAQRNHESGRWDTVFSLSAGASQRFEEFTGSHINPGQLAIVLDNKVVSAPRIESAISGEGRIVGAADAGAASDLAISLRSGALPAPVQIIEGMTVGPSLGTDSIRKGITSGIIGLSLVISSMVMYYRGAGINAVVTLLLNAIITIAALNMLGANWTLPGIAGLVLSIGMAVDSNVLIFERIKEEIRNGKSVAAAISTGFKRAFVTIIDTHVTTVVAGAFLFLFGTGAVQGFAVTLAVGLAANLFTAVFISRALFELQLFRKPKPASLSIGGAGLDFNLNFMRNHKWMAALSLVMVAVSIAAILGLGFRPGLDFRGGTQIDVKFEQNPGVDNVRRTIAQRLPEGFMVQETQTPGEFIIETASGNEVEMDQIRRNVSEGIAELGSFEIRSTNFVGPRAGEEMRHRAVMVTSGALGGMLAYIAFRFKWNSGVAAIIATIHDVIITLGLFALTEREITLNIVAALLTLIGYSMNDKIVVFDRVRENQRVGLRIGSFLELVNLSINQTLSRTMLTAGPTLLACLALYFWGGEVLNGIAFALFTGILAGTYSSIFVASTLLVMLRR